MVESVTDSENARDFASIAVIGMGCRLPGGIASPQQLWEALCSGADLISEVPPDRWDADAFFDTEPGLPGRSVSKWGGFLDDVAGFDAEFFGFGEREATATDPQHRLLLETSWEAVEHAGMDPATLSGSATGVFFGMTHNDYQLLTADADAIAGPYGFTGSNYGLASGRIAHHLGTCGPAYTVDSACSSGLLAAHLACKSLHAGESSLALAGGVNILLEPRKLASGSAQGMLSPTGRCRAFDAGADGFVSGEAAAVLVFKRLADARRDGDRILAVVRGTAANQDGRTVTIATPSQSAQTAVYRSALHSAGVDPATVGFVEAHGTGTPVGDPIEYAGLAAVYGTATRCALGSAKTNFGHSQSASGAVGLMKAVLAVAHGEVPPNLHFDQLSDELAEIDTALFVPQQVTPWPVAGEHPRRAAVSSYGLSGTNVHAVVEEAPPAQPAAETATHAPAGSPWIFPLSATSPEALYDMASRLADWVGEQSDLDVRDLAYTLARRRAHRTVRTAVLAADAAELVTALRAVAAGNGPLPPTSAMAGRGPVWVFSGQGSQWADMGAALLAREPVFADTVAQLEPLIEAEAGFSVSDALTSGETVTGIGRVQPTVFALQVALARTLHAYGVRPGAVIGHSMGEVAAAVVSGALSLRDGAAVICRRSALMQTLVSDAEAAGSMASVELPAQQVLSELTARGAADVVLSVIASPQSTVVGGAKGAIDALVADWEDRGVMARQVAVDIASHSSQVDPILDDLVATLHGIDPGVSTVPYYSATLYDPREPAEFDGYYWADNLRHAVRFAAAVQAALDDGHRVFAELSPHPLLTHAVEQNAAGLDISAIALATLRRGQELPHGLREVLADLYSAGAAVDFAALYPCGNLVDVPLPSWTHRHLMLAREAARPIRGAGATVVHPLLGAHVRVAEDPERHVWQGDAGTDTHPWLGDHQVHGVPTYPAAAYCEMALSAAATVFGDLGEVRDLVFDDALLLDARTEITASATLTRPGRADFVVQTLDGGQRVRRATATLVDPGEPIAPARRDIDALRSACPDTLDGAQLRAAFVERGLRYGPAFAGLTTAYTGGDAVLAEVNLPGPLRRDLEAYRVHPALLDACLHAVAAHPDVRSAPSSTLMLPLSLRRLRVSAPPRRARYCHVTVASVTPAGVVADLDLLDGDGTLVLSLSGLELGTGLSAAARREHVLNGRLLGIDWRRQDLPATSATGPGRWLIVSTSPSADARARDLSAELRVRGAEVSTAAWPIDDLAGQALTGVVAMVSGQGAEAVSRLAAVARGVAAEIYAPPRLYALTSGAQCVSPQDDVDLDHAGVRGLMRVIGVEHPGLRPTQIDIDHTTGIDCVATQLISGSEDDETAWRDGDFYVARLMPSPVRPGDRHVTTVKHDSGGLRLRIRTPGDLQSLEFVAADRTPPGPGQIEVGVTASALNFADVLVAYGRYPSFEGRMPELGADFAGVVTRIGAGVTNHRVGDRVAGLAASGAWATFVTCPADLAVGLPAALADDRAAAVPSAHATAWYSLHELARISSRDRVLIHSATGGVGQAAIAIARAAGAEIFATAGSPARRELLRGMGIGHVYDSRSTEFADQIRQDTDGYGVDIVLNSLPGAAQIAGLELLSPGGRFVELGKRDIYGDSKIGLFAFRRNLTFFAVDLALLTFTRPDVVRRVLDTVFAQIAAGELPVPDTTRYDLADAAIAIRAMGAADHTGKLVLEIPRDGDSRVAVPPEQAVAFRADGSYVITGGMGGLGLFVAERLAELGCGRIVLTGRSAPGPRAVAAIERMRCAGTEVEVCLGDIADAAAAQRAVAAATSTGRPVRGVLHAAAVVDDAMLANITDDLLARCWAPKVVGAHNLHQATAGQPLDWFCSFSSAAAMVGSPGQGAYAAANSGLDAFTHWRRRQGLPATAIAWGAWSQIGRGRQVAQDPAMAIAPEDGFHALEMLLRLDRGHTGYAPVAGSPWLADFAQRSTFAEAFRSLGDDRAPTSSFLVELGALPEHEWAGRLRRLVTDQVGAILRRTVDPDRPIAEYGLDSLGVLEVRARVESETGIRVAATDITTARALAEHLVSTLTDEPPADGSAH